jgi:hypothetical protein
MWEELESFEKSIDQLSARVRRATAPVGASGREMVTLISQEITCVEDSLDEKFATFYNGSGQSMILHRLSVEVYIQPPSLVATDERRVMTRFANGYISRVSPGLEVGMFDFFWNYSLSSRQSAYSRQPVGSTMFNGLEKSQAFDLHEPLVVKPVDSIEFRMRPLAYLLPGSAAKTAGTNYFVSFLAFGYRRPL